MKSIQLDTPPWSVPSFLRKWMWQCIANSDIESRKKDSGTKTTTDYEARDMASTIWQLAILFCASPQIPIPDKSHKILVSHGVMCLFYIDKYKELFVDKYIPNISLDTHTTWWAGLL